MKLIEKKQARIICDYCLLLQPHIYDTKKIGLTKTFASDICTDCMLFQLGQKSNAQIRKQQLEGKNIHG
jgi:hypothetical protein